MRITDYTLYSGSAITASVNSDAIDMTHNILLSVQMVWTATTAAASVTLQVSNDGTTYIDTAQTQAIADNSGAVMLSLIDFPYKYARAKITYTSGSVTTLVLKVIAKGL